MVAVEPVITCRDGHRGTDAERFRQSLKVPISSYLNGRPILKADIEVAEMEFFTKCPAVLISQVKERMGSKLTDELVTLGARKQLQVEAGELDAGALHVAKLRIEILADIRIEDIEADEIIPPVHVKLPCPVIAVPTRGARPGQEGGKRQVPEKAKVRICSKIAVPTIFAGTLPIEKDATHVRISEQVPFEPRHRKIF